MTGAAILIAAQSGRALAAAARRAGNRPFVADLFGDEDTRALAAGYRRVPGRFGAGPGARGVEAALSSLVAEAGEPMGLVLGSGFEGAPGLMRRLAGRFPLLGATPDAVAALKDPAGFAALCRRLGIPHPEIARAPVTDPGAWLIKRRGASGGHHIRPAAPGRLPAGAYLQRRVPGLPRSLNALADGRAIAVLAVTEQWVSPGPGRPFRYAGAAGPAVLPAMVREAAEQALTALVAATGLCGLVSADLMVDGEAWWLLEVNPRPGATLDVLDRGPVPLFAAHLAAARGLLPEHRPRLPGAAATEILYADAAIPAVPALDWPDWAMDRPPAGSRVEAGAPICTVLAEGADAAAARRAVAARAAELRARLEERPADAALAFAGRRSMLDGVSRDPLSRVGEGIPPSNRHPTGPPKTPTDLTGHRGARPAPARGSHR
ncbi:tetrahydromethanopterin C1 transfer protein [Methylobacterium currus]|uniref:Tetrahydromethanopterin C1 transfer protein n=1 Tax=Methylobacterium currus TaxID=2051553 RepID=A0A2R4WG52_9HYPH|nr:ATP-grasp domain-containing protein [Methylobacterium currus]AWB20499.1 tetrahydromethanopterin C1 transfer protein [Methylobacterium currus]